MATWPLTILLESELIAMMMPRTAGAILAAGMSLVTPTGVLAADLSVRTSSSTRVLRYATGPDFGKCTYFDFIGRSKGVFTNEYTCNIFYRNNLAAGYTVAWHPSRRHARRYRLY
jgi:hypothetical protein